MSGPLLVERDQIAALADRHGLTVESPDRVAPVYGRWSCDALEIACTWHERGWWVGLTALHPNGGPSWWLKTDYRPPLASVERLVLAAVEDFESERSRAA